MASPTTSTSPAVGRLSGVDVGLDRYAVRALVLSFTWPLALVAVFAAGTARLGFNPTDDGLDISYADRILSGQVPHLSFISPRPVGSAILHLVDDLLPGPLLLESRILALAEYMAIAVLFGVLVFRKTPVRWTVMEAAAVAIAFVVGLHTFPLMPWYTTDGILLSLAGWTLLLRPERRHGGLQLSGLLLAGAAATMKQSFFLVPVIAVVLAVGPTLASHAAPKKRLMIAASIAFAPGAAMVLVLAALGAFPAMWRQLLNVGAIDWWSAFEPLQVTLPLTLILVLISIAISARAQVRLRSAHFDTLRRGVDRAVAGLALAIVVLGHLALGGRWGDELLWLLVVYTVTGAVLRREVPLEPTLVILLAWMSALSWGYPVSDLAAGGVLLLLWRPMIEELSARRAQSWLYRTAALTLALLTVATGLLERQAHVYRDRPAAALTASLDRVSPVFDGIDSSPVTRAYLSDIVDCVQRHPAGRVAVLPDNPIIYRALRLHNPLPIDWAYPPDYAGSGDRLVESARGVDQGGDYLVLFQSFPADSLAGMTLPDYQAAQRAVSANPDQRLPYAPGVLQAVRDQLHGSVLACGSFIAVYSPA